MSSEFEKDVNQHEQEEFFRLMHMPPVPAEEAEKYRHLVQVFQEDRLPPIAQDEEKALQSLDPETRRIMETFEDPNATFADCAPFYGLTDEDLAKMPEDEEHAEAIAYIVGDLGETCEALGGKISQTVCLLRSTIKTDANGTSSLLEALADVASFEQATALIQDTGWMVEIIYAE